LLREIFEKELLTVLQEKPYSLKTIEVSVPAQKEYGDYATNAALQLPAKLKKSPALIADEIIALLPADNFTYSQKNGFINAHAADEAVFEQLKEINEDYARNIVSKKQKYLLEYISANPTGPLHIGHGRWAAMGDTLARIFKHLGLQLDTEFYINDAGQQIKKLYASVEAVKRGEDIPEDGYHGEYIQQLADSTDPVQKMLEIQQDTLKKFRVEFNHWFSEKNLHDNNELQTAMDRLTEKKLVYQQDGASWLKTTQFGDDKDRVLLKEDGQPTYFLADIAYHIDKVERGYKSLINIWGADHHGYIGRIKAIFQALYPDQEHQLDIIIGQLVSLFKNGEPLRMSKRAGTMVMLSDLIEEIGVDAARYYMVTRSFDTHLEFDIEQAKKKSNENPVYYVQYAHARICSIFKQLEQDVDLESCTIQELEPAERELMMILLRFPDELGAIINSYAVQRLPAYLEEVARSFHRFYHSCKVLGEEDQVTAKRLIIIDRTRKVLAIGLQLMGISAPEKM